MAQPQPDLDAAIQRSVDTEEHDALFADIEYLVLEKRTPMTTNASIDPAEQGAALVIVLPSGNRYRLELTRQGA